MGEKIFKINIDSTCNPLKAINLNSCSFKDIYTDIPKAFEEGIDKYFSYDESKKDLLPNDDICKKVIEEYLINNYSKEILETIHTKPKESIFNKLNIDGKVESEGILKVSKKEFCSKCVMKYSQEYLRPKILTEIKYQAEVILLFIIVAL
ncbi:MAG: hypothetical protein PUH01_08735 [Pseudomonadota bacterium]|nr:hypothetical protein [Pseudomonadota bacterium]